MTPLVLLHGLSTTPEVWAEVRTERETLAPVLPARESMDAIAAALLEQLPPRFALAGFSLGGYVALAMLANAPQRIECLALVSTSAGADKPDASAYRERLIAMAQTGRYQAIDAKMAPLLMHPRRLDDAAIIELRERMAVAYGSARYVAHQRASSGRPDRHALLETFTGPALVAVGREDRITPLALSQEMARRLPAAELAVFEQCGHLSPVEAPEALGAALRRMLDS
ncbi:MAG: alpha/beta fold hydrolase [Betaproteobacteria bacterium]|nr:alpha/beta fold hydrolase [Betaproteobacteria bacterium]